MTKIIVGNWKMFGSNEILKSYFEILNIKAIKPEKIIIAVPFLFLNKAIEFSDNVAIFAQDVSCSTKTASTGETCSTMLKNLGCNGVIIGHSERRTMGEDEIILSQKLTNACRNNLEVIFCIGETIEEKENKMTEKVIYRQIEILQSNCPNAMIAYEPRWAIGTGAMPSRKEIVENIKFIKNICPNNKILYGGSVNEDNAKNILEIEVLDGILVGAASQNPNIMVNIANFSV